MWTPVQDAQILMLRCDKIHPYDIADMLSMQRHQVEARLTYLRQKLGYEYPPLKVKKKTYTQKEVDAWSLWVNTGRTQKERCDIIREIARLNKTSYEAIYNRLNSVRKFQK